MNEEVKSIYILLLTRANPSWNVDIKSRVSQCEKYWGKGERDCGPAYVCKYIPSRYYKDPKVRTIKWTEK